MIIELKTDDWKGLSIKLGISVAEKQKRIQLLESAMQEFSQIDLDMFEEHELKQLITNQISKFQQLLQKPDEA